MIRNMISFVATVLEVVFKSYLCMCVDDEK